MYLIELALILLALSAVSSPPLFTRLFIPATFLGRERGIKGLYVPRGCGQSFLSDVSRLMFEKAKTHSKWHFSYRARAAYFKISMNQIRDSEYACESPFSGEKRNKKERSTPSEVSFVRDILFSDEFCVRKNCRALRLYASRYAKIRRRYCIPKWYFARYFSKVTGKISSRGVFISLF